jgi:transcriptional antiterminator RfaH
MYNWYLIRTKTGAEKTAEKQLEQLVERTFLPLARTQIRQGPRTIQRISPVFPCYLFAFFDLAHAARQIRYTPGVRDIVRFGDQAAVVPVWVIDALLSRCAEEPVDLSGPGLLKGAHVKIVHGPFQEFDAIFDGYSNATERVAVLFSIMSAERRVLMPATWVAAAA